MPIFQATDIVEMALELEKSGEAFYRAVAKKAKSAENKRLFVHLADAEVNHYNTFKQLSQTTWDQPLVPAEEWTQYLMYLQATIQSVFFQGKDKALALAHEVTDETEALRMAMGFEKETLLFFHDLRDMVSASDKDTVTRIINEEKQHLRQLADMLQSAKAA